MMSMVSQLHSCLLQLVLSEQVDTVTYNGAIYSQQGDNTRRRYLRKQAKDLHIGKPRSGHC